MTAVFIAMLAIQLNALMFGVLYVTMFFWNGVALGDNRTEPAAASDKRASMLSMVSMAVQLGGLVGSVAFGIIAGSAGIPTAWFVAAAVLATSASLLPVVANGKTVQSDPETVGPAIIPSIAFPLVRGLINYYISNIRLLKESV